MGRRTRKTGRSKHGHTKKRRLLLLALVLLLLALGYGALGVWFVHHPPRYLATAAAKYPWPVTEALTAVGNPLGDITDALALTGHDAVYEYDEAAPAGEVLFAGAPQRTGAPAPRDIKTLDRGDFIVGWSPSLRHPVWCAYHVLPAAPHEVGERPHFRKDKAAANCPAAGDYSGSGYDSGHLAPNYAITRCFGNAAQQQTFLMSNVAAQTPSLNRGVWREIEHRIAELWSAKYGELWVIVGAISDSRPGSETISGSDIDVPLKFYQIIVAQTGLDVRAQAVVFDQIIAPDEWPTRHLVTIDELEELSGLDFLPELPEFIQSPLEAELPSRLWPINKSDVFRQLWIHYRR